MDERSVRMFHHAHEFFPTVSSSTQLQLSATFPPTQQMGRAFFPPSLPEREERGPVTAHYGGFLSPTNCSCLEEEAEEQLWKY
jgi:hypothetical protein